MSPPTFEWDSRKATANQRRHGVSFKEATTAFRDPMARIHEDPEHSFDERREILVGYSTVGRLLLVAFLERDGKIRLISARRATRDERKNHEENS